MTESSNSQHSRLLLLKRDEEFRGQRMGLLEVLLRSLEERRELREQRVMRFWRGCCTSPPVRGSGGRTLTDCSNCSAPLLQALQFPHFLTDADVSVSPSPNSPTSSSCLRTQPSRLQTSLSSYLSAHARRLSPFRPQPLLLDATSPFSCSQAIDTRRLLPAERRRTSRLACFRGDGSQMPLGQPTGVKMDLGGKRKRTTLAGYETELCSSSLGRG
jgi:hypothetical protein